MRDKNYNVTSDLLHQCKPENGIWETERTTEVTMQFIYKQHKLGPITMQEDRNIFDEWFTRSRQSLHFIACRILGDPGKAELAVHNCWLSASSNYSKFDSEGTFHSWLLRLQIDEALHLLHQDLKSVHSHPATPK